MPEPGIIENGVLVGRNGYLFLAGGAHNILDIVTKKQPIRPEAFDNFRSNLQGRITWAASRSVSYLHIIMPDKQSIIPEDWPFPGLPLRVGAEYIKRNSDIDFKILYPVAALRDAKQKAISKVDTHLRDHGTILITALVVEALSNENQDNIKNFLLAKIRKSGDPVSGDLGVKLDPVVEDFDDSFQAPLPGRWLHNHLKSGNEGIIDLRFNPTAIYRKRVALFGDSFGRQIARFLQYWYSEVYFFRTGFFHDDIASQCQADILITENIERYLDFCRPDQHRPHFLLQPFNANKPYAPPSQFVEALEAILSYPRKPYQDFIGRISPKDVSVSNDFDASILKRFDDVRLLDCPPSLGLLATLEEPKFVPQKPPAFFADFSDRGLVPRLLAEQHVHGSYLVQRKNWLLFGQNHLVNHDGSWACESRSFKDQFINYFVNMASHAEYSGYKPIVESDGKKIHILRTSDLSDEQLVRISEPVFLATPLEPDNYGRWIATVATKARIYKKYGAGRKFFCRVGRPWQLAFLKVLGISESAILPHNPGRAYICDDLMTVEYSVTNMTISDSERTSFFELVAQFRKPNIPKQKLFISRLSQARQNPNYRVLRNEIELTAMLSDLGFIAIEPEELPFEEQIAIFAAAEQIVALGGAGIYNAVFCAPGADFLTIEASDAFSYPHAQLLSSLGLRYGMIFGSQDDTKTKSVHAGWSIDIERTRAAIMAFLQL
jgi:hypothetical protein